MDHMVEMTLRNLIVGGGPIPSAIILQPAGDENDSELVLPISVGTVDAANVARATNADDHKRPATHALLVDTIDALGGELESVTYTFPMTPGSARRGVRPSVTDMQSFQVKK